MKKYYFIVLTALLTFALNLNAQENEEQETYNMTVTLPDGTTVTVNTEDVNEITFANGKLNVTGTSIDEIVQKLRQALDAIAENRTRSDYALHHSANVEVKVAELENKVEVHDASLQALSDRELALTEKVANLKLENNDLKTALGDMMWVINNLEARLAALEAVVSSMKE